MKHTAIALLNFQKPFPTREVRIRNHTEHFLYDLIDFFPNGEIHIHVFDDKEEWLRAKKDVNFPCKCSHEHKQVILYGKGKEYPKPTGHPYDSCPVCDCFQFRYKTKKRND